MGGYRDTIGTSTAAVRPRCPRLSPLWGPAAGHRHRAGPGRRADPPRPGRARARPGGAWPRPGRDRVASPLGQTRAGSRSPGPGPAPSACSLTVRPAPAQDDAGSAGAREVAARPRPSRRAATAARAGFGGRPDLAGRFAEVALIVPMRRRRAFLRQPADRGSRSPQGPVEGSRTTRRGSGRRASRSPHRAW